MRLFVVSKKSLAYQVGIPPCLLRSIKRTPTSHLGWSWREAASRFGSGIRCFFANWKPSWTHSNSLPQQKFYYNYTYLTETDVT